MNPINDSATILFSYFEYAQSLNDIYERCNFYDAVLHYSFFENMPNIESIELQRVIKFLVKPNIDKSIMYRKVGQKGGRPKKDKDKGNRIKDMDKDKDGGVLISQNPPFQPQKPFNTYPQSVEDVIAIAEDNCIMITEEEAEKYFLNRDSADWHNANGNRIRVSGIVSDIKQWALRSKQYNRQSNSIDEGDNDLSQVSKSMLD